MADISEALCGSSSYPDVTRFHERYHMETPALPYTPNMESVNQVSRWQPEAEADTIWYHCICIICPKTQARVNLVSHTLQQLPFYKRAMNELRDYSNITTTESVRKTNIKRQVKYRDIRRQM